MGRIGLAFVFMLTALFATAQAQLPLPAAVQQAYVKGTRQASGKPGPAYWQNTANYKIKIAFNPATRLIQGKVDITYFNHSPDSLKQLLIKLYPNLYKRGVARKAKVNERDLGEGVKISAIKIESKDFNIRNVVQEGTNAYLPITTLAPGKHLTLSITYSYVLNKGSHIRTGQVDEGAHFIAYFFPRIAVYDDVDGWNKYPYTGDEEFYNDFSNFSAELTLPRNYQVWATGDLSNVSEVYQPAIAARIKEAELSDSVIDVITQEDLQAQRITKGAEFNIWRYEAKNVPDFVFAVSNHYIWKSSSLVVDSLTGRRTRVDAVFNPSHKDYYEVIDFARQTVAGMSFKFPKWPYPYSHETIFDGLDQMEYPMMVNDNPVDKREDAITLTVHEIFHTMFPFYMGTNETKHAWMDEGWATLGEWLLSPLIDSTLVDDYGVEQTAATSGTKNDSPVVTLTPELNGAGVFTNSYPKAAMGYLFVKDYLGNERFLKALHHYMRDWNGKHPLPSDFFNSMNVGAGENLDWFWKRWFFDDGITDMAITGVIKDRQGYEINILNKSGKPMPVYLTLEFTDGSTDKMHKTIAVWKNDTRKVAVEVLTDKILKKVVMGDPHVPDRDFKDNRFDVK